MRHLLALLVSLSVSLISAAEPAKPTHVVILIMDGARWTETWGEPTQQYIPRMARELAPQGVVFANFRNDGPTYTNAGHAAICTGFYQEINNNGKELPAHPSMFQLFLKASGAKASDAWLITSKDKLLILRDTSDAEWHGKFLCSADCGAGGRGLEAGYREDVDTWARVQEILPKDHPRLVLINLKQPDAAGHSGKWKDYLQGVRSGDAIAADLWKLLQADPVYAGHTAFFVTNDHGRHLDGHADGFVNHGDDCEGCHHISLLAMGPGFRAGASVMAKHDQLDLNATVAGILGFAVPGSSKGKPITELTVAP